MKKRKPKEFYSVTLVKRFNPTETLTFTNYCQSGIALIKKLRLYYPLNEWDVLKVNRLGNAHDTLFVGLILTF